MPRTAAASSWISVLARVARLSFAAAIVSMPAAPRLAAQPLPVDGAFDVNQFTTSFQRRPGVRMADSGAAVFVWDSDGQDGSGEGVVARKMASNGSFFNEFVVNQTTAGDQDRPNLAMNASGDFAVTWRDGPNTGRAVALRSTLSNGSSLGSETQASTTAGDMLHSALCRFDDDTTVVVWQNPFLVFRRFAANGTALTPEVPFAGISDPDDLSVACLSSQRFVAVWTDSDSDGQGIFAVLVNGQDSQVGAPFEVPEDPAGDQY
ncbi:MAG: hypothetical protein KBA72_06905, partial [Thermoanaerobaculia bacterium]|nr:hypothetical protein [Thermoanaerobaculia bacterium]